MSLRLGWPEVQGNGEKWGVPAFSRLGCSWACWSLSYAQLRYFPS